MRWLEKLVADNDLSPSNPSSGRPIRKTRAAVTKPRNGMFQIIFPKVRIQYFQSSKRQLSGDIFLIGLLFVVTIIAAPIGLGLIQYSKFLLLPFSYDMVSKSEIDGDANKNILWQTYGFILKTVYVIFLGIPMVILSLVQIVCCFCSIIGIPVAIVMAKSLGTLLQPVGKVCVDHSVAQALLVEQGRSQLANRNKIEQQ